MPQDSKPMRAGEREPRAQTRADVRDRVVGIAGLKSNAEKMIDDLDSKNVRRCLTCENTNAPFVGIASFPEFPTILVLHFTCERCREVLSSEGDQGDDLRLVNAVKTRFIARDFVLRDRPVEGRKDAARSPFCRRSDLRILRSWA